ncbi:MAG: hypothetical protein WC581_05400 [Thermodesulfovibrionales bacterium]
MNKNLVICIMVVLFLSIGCRNTYYLKPTSTCQPLSAFDTLVISPFNGDAAFVEEEQYRLLPHQIAVATTEQLKDQIEDSHMFSKVIQSSDCVDRAIRIDGKIYSLSHKRRSFNVFSRGQIINCQTGESLLKFNIENNNSESSKLPYEIAEELTNAIKARLICEKPK